MRKDLKKIFIEQIEKIVNEYENLKSNSKYEDLSDQHEKVESLLIQIKAAIIRISGKNSEYYKAIEEKKGGRFEGILYRHLGALDALYRDIQGDYVKTLSELIHAVVFSDYLEMSEYLLKEGYKDAAAVIAGSTLEEHLRTLCLRERIDIVIKTQNGRIKSKKASQMNSDLAKQNIYSKLELKQVTAWLEIRNNAAHANYNTYTDNDVDLLIKGLKNFFSKYPA